MDYVLALDAGTTGVRACVFNPATFEIVSSSYQELTLFHPYQDTVEQDPVEIIEKLKMCIKKAVTSVEGRCLAIGITNQRETIVCWNRHDKRPVYNAIVWQDKRSQKYCQQLSSNHKIRETIRTKTGLVIDPYFSATKIQWILSNLKLDPNQIKVGTVDSWIIENLTENTDNLHFTDFSNASRTLLFNIETLTWDKDLLDVFEIPEVILPQCLPSKSNFGQIKNELANFLNIKGSPKIASVLGDQQSALFGQACFEPSLTKATFGTGSFVLMNLGSELISPIEGLLTTVSWAFNEKDTFYALEGSNLVSGSAIKWLRDNIKLIKQSADLEPLAKTVQDSASVVFVPAFVGLGSPHWDPNAKAMILGLTQGVTPGHIARALIEAMVFQTKDIIQSMKQSSIMPTAIKIDGGASQMNLLAQMLADSTGIEVQRPKSIEATALGTAYLAAIWTDLCDLETLKQLSHPTDVFLPQQDNSYLDSKYNAWLDAINRVKG